MSEYKGELPALKTCPFCDTDKIEFKFGESMFCDVHIACDECGFSGPNFDVAYQEGLETHSEEEQFRINIEDATKHWNMRGGKLAPAKKKK